MTEHPSGHKEGHQKKEVVVSSKPAPEKKEGLRFAIREGGRTVGAGVVSSIIA